jgi:hypothetical protein
MEPNGGASALPRQWVWHQCSIDGKQTEALSVALTKEEAVERIARYWLWLNVCKNMRSADIKQSQPHMGNGAWQIPQLVLKRKLSQTHLYRNLPEISDACSRHVRRVGKRPLHRKLKRPDSTRKDREQNVSVEKEAHP